jgi:hypothetical protein
MNKADRDRFATAVGCVAFDAALGECLLISYTQCDCWIQAAAGPDNEEGVTEWNLGQTVQAS